MSMLSTTKYRNSCLILAMFFALLLHCSANGQTVLRVDGDDGLAVPNPPDPGDTWSNAYKYLQDAIARAEVLLDFDPFTPVHLWVAATDASNPYVPDRDAANPGGTGDRTATFLLDFNNIQLLGGFQGNETDPDDRDPAEYITVLSGELGGACGDPNAGDCFFKNLTPGCNDLCNGQPCPGCCQLVCEIDPNCCPDLGVWDEVCVDIAGQECPPANPAGPRAYHVVTADGVDDSVRIDGFTITRGLADGGGSDEVGSGMSIVSASPAVVRVTFTDNAAPDHGGAMNITGTSDPLVVNTLFIDNTGHEAGALHTEAGSAGGTFVNCLFIDNHSVIEGGAINPGGGETLTFVNCTFADNTVDDPDGGGAIFTEIGAGPVNLTNCILWDNEAAGQAEQIVDDVEVVTVTYSDVEGGWGIPADMNIDDDPLFFDPANGNYRLAAGSPCIEKGDPDDSVITDDIFDLDNDDDLLEPTPDLDLGDRIVDDYVDMGAYESVPCPWDLNGDCVVGAGDVLLLLQNWDDPYDADDLDDLLAAWGPCPCDPEAVVPSLEDELDDACLTSGNWDDFLDKMGNGSAADKENYLCWMIHYLDHCTQCFCPHTGVCPGADPFN